MVYIWSLSRDWVVIDSYFVLITKKKDPYIVQIIY